MKAIKSLLLIAAIFTFRLLPQAKADEQLLGYVRGAETLPKNSLEFVQAITSRFDKGTGSYTAFDSKTEVEYGITDRFTAAAYLKLMAINTKGILIDGYVPGDKSYGPRLSGAELSGKYNILSPAKDDFGLSSYLSLDYSWLDPHSGQKKQTTSVELEFLFQKYFLEGQLIWVGNLGMESTYAKREKINNLPPGFDWPTTPEVELELKAGTGISYRFVNKWYVGAEALYETEYETEIGQERWSVFAGPSIHFADQRWWTTLTWINQLAGGGEKYPGQSAGNLHLIEKTKNEIRLKVGLNF